MVVVDDAIQVPLPVPGLLCTVQYNKLQLMNDTRCGLDVEASLLQYFRLVTAGSSKCLCMSVHGCVGACVSVCLYWALLQQS